jgi:hypothetical protein
MVGFLAGHKFKNEFPQQTLFVAVEQSIRSVPLDAPLGDSGKINRAFDN